MRTRKLVGALFIVACLLAAGGALVLAFTEETVVPDVMDDRDTSAAVYGGSALVAFIIGVVLLVTGGPQERMAIQKAPEPEAPMDIKRTEMKWAAPAASASAGLDERLEDVNRRMAQLKVQLGLEQISKDSYNALMEELQKEKADVELKIRRGE